MEQSKVKPIIDHWLERLAPYCERIEAAGSYRRGKDEVKDIDLVAIPKIQTELDLFGLPGTQINLLEVAMQRMFWDREYLATIKSGPRMRQILTHEKIHLELWMVTPPAEWGVIYLIRTGPADFGHWCVTTKSKGGTLPSYLRFDGGAIWHNKTKIETPEEADVFKILGMEYIEPGERRAGWREIEHG
jgi:DNA polymerase IV (family X)